MSKREKKPERGAPAWMVTFADLMSLLVCFFVLIVSFSIQDKEKLQVVAGSLKEAFGVVEVQLKNGVVEHEGVPIRDYLKQGYDRFTTLVGEGRDLTPEQVDAVARGRVWTGAEAIQIGLVDELGGMATAITKARELAEIDPESDVRLVTYPMSSGGLAFLGASSSATAQELKALGQLTAVLSDPDVQALMSELEAARGPQVQMRMPSLIER